MNFTIKYVFQLDSYDINTIRKIYTDIVKQKKRINIHNEIILLETNCNMNSCGFDNILNCPKITKKNGYNFSNYIYDGYISSDFFVIIPMNIYLNESFTTKVYDICDDLKSSFRRERKDFSQNDLCWYADTFDFVQNQKDHTNLLKIINSSHGSKSFDIIPKENKNILYSNIGRIKEERDYSTYLYPEIDCSTQSFK